MNSLIKVKLAKDWNKHKTGTVIEVDTLRAKWLRKNNFVDKAKK